MDQNVKCFSKLKWTPQEQSYLRSLRQIQQIQSWKKIATFINQAFLEKNRTGKQCRQRYMNYVRFGQETPKINGWAPNQDQLLFRKYIELGAKWVQIGKQMPGRSENCLKNRFYGALRKIIRKLNKRMKQNKLKQKNTIKTDLLIKILQYQTSFLPQSYVQCDKTQEFLEDLKKSLIKMAVELDEESKSQDIEDLLKNINKFGVMVKQSRSIKQNNRGLKANEAQNPDSPINSYHDTEQKQQKQDGQKQDIQKQKKQNKEKQKIIKNVILLSNPQENVNEKEIDFSEPKLNRINFGKENHQELI